MEHETCVQCGGKVLVMAFRNTGICSDECKKAAGRDTPSVGTHMFVTRDEQKLIQEVRAHAQR